MPINPVYIDTKEALEEALIEIREYVEDPLWTERGKKPILALDVETYNAKLTPSEAEELEAIEASEEEDEYEEEEAPSKKKKKEKVPRPILLSNGTYTGQIRLIQIGLNPVYNPKLPINNVQFVIDCNAFSYEYLGDKLRDILSRSQYTWS